MKPGALNATTFEVESLNSVANAIAKCPPKL